jgi:hypothetical protein
VTEATDPAAVLAALAAWGLPGERPLPPIPEVTLGRAVVAAAVEHRLIGVLAIAAQAGQIQAPDEVVELAADRHRSALLWCLQLEVELLAVLDHLAVVGVEPLVVKGPAIAHLDVPDPALRTFADLDLLVPAGQIDVAVAALMATGARRPWAERRPGFDRRFAKSVTLRTTDGIELDVHRTLCDGAHAVRLPIDRIFRDSTSFALVGHPVACPSSVHRLLHSAYHLILGSPTARLGSLRDLATALTADGLRWADVVAEAERWGGESVVALAVQRVRDELGVDAPGPTAWADALVVSAREHAIIERQRREGSGLGRAKLDALAEPQPWARRGAYALALALPTRAHLRSRGLRRRDLVRRR